MNRSTRIILWIIVIAVGGLAFLLLLPSLIGSLMILMLIFAAVDYSARRYRNTVRTFNSALRAVCHHDGAIGRVALAFSRSGPLSGPCYEFARRLMTGEDPLDAAVMSRVPLQLSTAIAMQTPAPDESSSGSAAEDDRFPAGSGQSLYPGQYGSSDSAAMPAYGQFIYLTATALIMCLVLAFMRVMILPTIDKIFEEFHSDPLPYRWLFSSVPALLVVALLFVAIIVVAPLLNRGHLWSRHLPRWVPAMPRLAERRSEFLYGLADGIDAGWPIGRTLATGHAISVSNRSLEARSIDRAMRLIEKGVEPIESVRRVGWIDASEASWLDGATPPRSSELLREIADQGVRDARYNLRWLMSIFFPLVVVLLGACVLAYAFGFFTAITELIRGLS